jgi:predicted ATPase
MFLRAEDVFGFSNRIIAQMKEFQNMKDGFRETLADGSRGQFEAMALAEKEKAMLASRYGVDPHARSHGESFLHLLKTRLVPNGLYFLDEPETPLSPTRFLALIVLIHDSVNAGSQFVIATHSPILLAFPFAEILRLDHSNIAVTSYEEVENVRIIRDFLNDPRGDTWRSCFARRKREAGHQTTLFLVTGSAFSLWLCRRLNFAAPRLVTMLFQPNGLVALFAAISRPSHSEEHLA